MKYLRKTYVYLFLFILINFVFSENNIAYSFEINDYYIISPKIDSKLSPESNIIKVLNLYHLLDERVKQHETDLKNTNYPQSRNELTKAKTLLNLSESYFKKGDLKQGYSNLELVLKSMRNAQFNLMHSRVAETRGLYLDADSIPLTKKDITTLIKKIKHANFNVIYPEVFRRGYAIVSNPVAEIDPKFKSLKFDILKYIIDEAHKNNIDVDPWVWVFRVKSPTYGDSFFKRYPNLIAKREKTTFEDREPLFLSPASSESRTLILKLLKHFTRNYSIDGFLLDYIRYDETMGNDTITLKNFKKYYFAKHKHDPPEIVPGNPVFVEFQIWRETQVTEMVKAVRKELDLIKPGISIGTAIFRTEKEGRLLKMQDWRLWANNRYINYVCPMLYTDNIQDLNAWLNSETDGNSRNDYLYPSLGAHKFYTSDDIFPQIGLIQKRNIPGLNIFSLYFIEEKDLNDLENGVFRKPAVIPNKKPVFAIKLTLKDISEWLNKISGQKNLYSKELDNFSNSLKKLINSLENSKSNDYSKITRGIEGLRLQANNLRKDNRFTEGFLNEITEPLDYSVKLTEKAQIYSERSVNKPTMPPLPILEETKELPVYNVFKTTIFPKIDGVMEVNFWDKIDPISPFYWNNGISGSEVETVVKLAYNKEKLFIIFENYETDMEDLRNDYIQILIQLPEGKKLFKYTLNSKGNIIDKNSSSLSKSSVKLYKNKWISEIEIPLSEINIISGYSKSLKANFIRFRNKEFYPFLQWAVSYKQITNSSGFGTLNFI